MTRFCILPLCPGTPPENISVQTSTAKNKYAGNAYQITSKGDLIWYLRQCLFLPPKQRLIKVIRNNQLATWPGLTATEVENCLPDSSPAIDKDHMKRQRKGIRTTQDKLNKKLNIIETERDINPPVEKEKQNQIFTCIATVDKKDGTIYVDDTENFPIRSIDEKKFI